MTGYRDRRYPTTDIAARLTPRAGREQGQGLVEYGLILALIALVCAVCLLFFGDQLAALLTLITNQV